MRKLVAVAAMVLGMGVAGLAQAGIAGSSHDFTDGLQGLKGNTGTGTIVSEAWNGRSEICRVCHVPHDHGQALQRYTNGLLWNHTVSSATYTMYDNSWSSTLTGVQATQPVGTAKLCLGCHDGSVAIDTFDKYAGGAATFGGTSTTVYDAGYKVPGFADGTNLDLRGTHPLSIAFPALEIGTQFNEPTTASWAGGGTVASTLDNGKVQCSTCHDVHSENIVAGTHLLRAGQTVAQGGTASALCLTCHIK